MRDLKSLLRTELEEDNSTRCTRRKQKLRAVSGQRTRHKQKLMQDGMRRQAVLFQIDTTACFECTAFEHTDSKRPVHAQHEQFKHKEDVDA